MADEGFNLNSLWKCFSASGAETLQISCYQGTSSFNVFRKNTESRKPVVKIVLNGAPAIKIHDILKMLLEAQPDTRVPFNQMAFNKETRNYEQAASFVFYKDEKRCYGVEIASKSMTTPIKFMFKCANTFAVNGQPMTDEEKSTLGVRELMEILRDMHMTTLLSRFNMANPSQNYKGKSNSGNGSYGSKQSRDPFANGGGSGITSSEEAFG